MDLCIKNEEKSWLLCSKHLFSSKLSFIFLLFTSTNTNFKFKRLIFKKNQKEMTKKWVVNSNGGSVTYGARQNNGTVEF
jgi:hypothetical protein